MVPPYLNQGKLRRPRPHTQRSEDSDRLSILWREVISLAGR